MSEIKCQCDSTTQPGWNYCPNCAQRLDEHGLPLNDNTVGYSRNLRQMLLEPMMKGLFGGRKHSFWGKCPCGSELPDAAWFCPGCGRHLMLKNEEPKKGSQAKSASFRAGIRAQVLEVVVRQAMAGAPWREICKGPMQINGISEEEVQAELDRRRVQPS